MTAKTTKTTMQRLVEARKLVRNTKHKKAGHNEYSKYDYFTPEQVEMIVAEVCDETGLVPLCSLKRNEHGLYQEMVLANVDSEDTIIFHLATAQSVITATNDAQQMGGTDTYSERYIKMKVFGIKDNTMDFDAQDNRKKTASKSEPKEQVIDIDDDL